MSQKREITILGAGLVGSLLALQLKKRSYNVTVYERRPDMRKTNIYAGKSINLAMSHRGWKALEDVGLKNDLEKIAIPLYGRQMHSVDGKQIYQQYGKNNEAIYSVSRGELNKFLINKAEQEGVNFIFDTRSSKVDTQKNIVYFENNGKEFSHKADLLIGADGAFSSLRQAYTLIDKCNIEQVYIEHGYKELNIPAGNNNSFLIEKNALHIWPRKNYMLIALPNIDGSFTCTLFFPFNGNPSFDSIKTKEEIKQFFDAQFSDAVPLMPTLVEDFENNPVSSLVTVKVSTWVYKDKSFLIGDAAHAIVPFYGQGMNAGFEDCTVLMQLLDENKDENWATILNQYQILRKPNGDAVLQLALNNFIEMRDKVAEPSFLERKRIEKEIGKLYPTDFLSVYEMVSFSHIPYNTALKSQHAQDILLEKIMSKGNFDNNIQNEKFKVELDSWIDEYKKEIASI